MLEDIISPEPSAGFIPETSRRACAAKNNLVRNAFAILQAFRGSEDWLTSRELSQRANLPKSSGHRLILTLEELGAVVRGPHGRYRPGMLLISLSHTVAIGQLLREASQRVMQDLAGRLGLTIHLGALEDGMVTYVNKVSLPNAFPPYTRVGSKLEAYCSGLGKVLLAALPSEQLENFILDGDLVAITPYTITDRARLRGELATIRLQGYAVDDREYQANMRCVAVPVRDAEGRVVAALSACGELAALPSDAVDRIQAELRGAAGMISQRITPTRLR
ncbi:MAG TPA: IclR family transcriptional regulator [Rhizomicrobium sp.]|jgi:DNA-binding IclR family transcriptional regulator|nr:IclR family transcriptional regulator [Rhizomicrobium sp.]